MNVVVESSKHCLNQLKEFLAQLTPTEYVEKLDILSGSTIGMHNRHIIEFFQCLIKGLLVDEMDYDARERSLLQETNLLYAIACIDNALIDLSMIKEDKEIKLFSSIGLNDEKEIIKSSINRELLYVVEHTIHHMAIIKMACKVSFPKIIFHDDFGVAYSTIKYRNNVHSNISS